MTEICRSSRVVAGNQLNGSRDYAMSTSVVPIMHLLDSYIPWFINILIGCVHQGQC